MTLIGHVLMERNAPIQHPRFPVLAARRTAPQHAAAASMVQVYPDDAVGAPDTLPDKDIEAGDLIHTELNRASYGALQTCYGSFDVEVWTDGGVCRVEAPECISAAAGHLCLGNSAHPHATFAASAGCLACSRTAEFVALTGSVCQFAPSVPNNSRVLIAVDSQSLLHALAKGLLLTHEDYEDRLWAQFLLMVRRGCTVVLQLFYSHVSFPSHHSWKTLLLTTTLRHLADGHHTGGASLPLLPLAGECQRCAQRPLWEIRRPSARNGSLVPRGSNPLLSQPDGYPVGTRHRPTRCRQTPSTLRAPPTSRRPPT